MYNLIHHCLCEWHLNEISLQEYREKKPHMFLDYWVSINVHYIDNQWQMIESTPTFRSALINVIIIRTGLTSSVLNVLSDTTQ